MTDNELCQWLRDTSSGIFRNSELAAIRIEELLKLLETYRESFTTKDGAQVIPGDKVWVIGSLGELKDSTVVGGSTNYMVFGGLVGVNDSFSSPEAAKEYLTEYGGQTCLK